MEATGLVLGVIPAVVELYHIAEAAYDFYREVKEFRISYHELYLCLEIERFRFKLWGDHMLSEGHLEEANSSRDEDKLFALFESILKNVCDTFSESSLRMSVYGEHALREGLDNEQYSVAHVENAKENPPIFEDLSISPRPRKRHAIPGLAKAAKFILRDKDKLEKLIKKLSHWNESLNKLTSCLDQESARRQLRTRFSTSDSDQLRLLELAAALLQHNDIASMAKARRLIEEGNRKESSAEEGFKILRTDSQYHLEVDELTQMGNPYKTETTRATAVYQGEPVIVDWRSCSDDTWRKENPGAFRLRTETLTKVLNSDLRPLNLCVLHCVGYLDRSTNTSGYAFRLPPECTTGQKPQSLYQILSQSRKARDIADLGERFKLAKALVSTIFEIHNLGWMHKNLQPRNIIFWPKSGTNKEPNLGKPYIVGFDVARLNRPDEMSEKPMSKMEDDLYRHPEYKGENPKSFIPSYDFYSLGVILFEIGMWRTVASSSRSDVFNPHLVEDVVMNGPVMDLKRFMGSRYRDAAVACLNKNLDAFWEDETSDLVEQSRVYLGQVESQVLNPIAQCNA